MPLALTLLSEHHVATRRLVLDGAGQKLILVMFQPQLEMKKLVSAALRLVANIARPLIQRPWQGVAIAFVY